jgi:hypothetical protein
MKSRSPNSAALVIVAALAIVAALVAGCAHAQSSAPAYSAAGLYNVGNAYARAGKPGMAVLNYERAALLAPTDPDIEANLNYVRVASHLAPLRRNRFERALALANPQWAAWIGIAGLCLVGVSLCAGKVSARFRFARAAGVLLGSGLMGLTVCNSIWLWPKLHEAVVIVAATPVQVTPVPMGEPLFELHEAEIVTMTARHEGFVLIRTGAGLAGWVSRADLGVVVPP